MRRALLLRLTRKLRANWACIRKHCRDGIEGLSCNFLPRSTSTAESIGASTKSRNSSAAPRSRTQANPPNAESRNGAIVIGLLPARGTPMSARITTPQVEVQDDQADDGLDVPEFLKISAERRKQAWLEFDGRRPSTPTPGRELTETERLYRASIERDKAAKRAADELRFQVMRAKAAADRAERQSIRQAVEEGRVRARPR